jgi:hypothetical protein
VTVFDLTKKGQTDAEKEVIDTERLDFVGRWYALVAAKTEDKFWAFWDAIETDHAHLPELLKYLEDHQLKYLDEWAEFVCQYFPDFGARVTSRVEGAHHQLKLALSSWFVGHLYDVVKDIHKMVEIQRHEHDAALATDEMRVAIDLQIPEFAQLQRKITHQGLRELKEQLNMAKSDEYNTAQNCTNVFHHRAGQTTEPVKICQDHHNLLCAIMSQPQNALSLQHEGRLQIALQAYRSGHFRSHRAAARAFNVKQQRLSERARGVPFRPEAMPNGLKLTRTEEQTIVQYILDLDSRGFAPRLCEVSDMADKVLGVRGGKPVGKHWAERFVTRSDELKMAFNRAKDRQRILQEDPETIGAWFKLVEDTKAKYGVHNNDVHNFDETGFQMGVIGSMKVVTGAERRARPELIQPGDREWVTVI